MFTLIILLGLGIAIWSKYAKFRNSNYQRESGHTFLKTVFNKGNYGEYLTFVYLEKIKGYHRIMTNLYLPKEDGSTTEVDLVMITETGIYVFESKNYGGWIFGDEKNKHWMQTFPNGKKHRLFNPIWQNNGHIKALKSLLESKGDSLYKSYIIFSERCTLKKINVKNPNVKVIKRNTLIKSIKNDLEQSLKLLTIEEIDEFYKALQPYTCVTQEVKKAHIEHIKRKSS